MAVRRQTGIIAPVEAVCIQCGTRFFTPRRKRARHCSLKCSAKTGSAMYWTRKPNTDLGRWREIPPVADAERINSDRLIAEVLQDKNFVERFWSKVQQGDGCWIWRGGLTDAGYGQVMVIKTPRLAHRVSFAFFNGYVTVGLCVCHKCDTPACVNPRHLFEGKIGDNNKDMNAKGRQNFDPKAWGETHPRAKLTERQVPQIRIAWSEGMSIGDLAASHGVTWKTMQALVTRKTWKHVA